MQCLSIDISNNAIIINARNFILAFLLLCACLRALASCCYMICVAYSLLSALLSQTYLNQVLRFIAYLASVLTFIL